MYIYGNTKLEIKHAIFRRNGNRKRKATASNIKLTFPRAQPHFSSKISPLQRAHLLHVQIF